jgi:hypothetical protein
MSEESREKHRVVIVGGLRRSLCRPGFAARRSLSRSSIGVTSTCFSLFYQAHWRRPADKPIPSVDPQAPSNVAVLLAEVVDFGLPKNAFSSPTASSLTIL